MAEVKITLTDQDQQQIEAILIDKDKEEALNFLSNLLARFKTGMGHACGPKVV
jgi:hypothetical protein